MKNRKHAIVKHKNSFYFHTEYHPTPIMKKILPFALLLICFATQAQNTFQVKLNGNGTEEAVGVTELSNGNFVLLSSRYVSGINMDLIISEVSGSGVLIKSKTLGTTNGELAKSICKTSDGNYIVSGSYFSSANDYDLLVAKIDTGFNTIWVKHLGATGGNDYANSVYEISPGRYAVTGTTGLSGSAKPSFIIMDDTGTIVREFHLNTNQFASPNYKGVYLNNGTFAFCNLTNSLCIVDTSGTIIKNNSTNFGIYTTNAMLTTGSKPVLIALSDYGSPQGGTSSITTFDSTGNTILLQKKYKSSANDLSPVKVLPDNAGGYIIAANATSLSNGNYTGILFRIDSIGTLLWSKKYTPTGSGGSKINDIERTTDGGYIAVGMTGTSATTILITKIDSSGNVLCNTSTYTLTSSSASATSSTSHSIATGTTSILTAITPILTPITSPATILCSTVGVNEIENPLIDFIYPNPSHSFIYSSLKINYPIYTTIYSSAGEKVMSQFGSLEEKTNITKIPSGLYLFEVKNKDGEILQQSKFIKE